MCMYIAVYTTRMISQNIDDGASTPVDPSVATPLLMKQVLMFYIPSKKQVLREYCTLVSKLKYC